MADGEKGNALPSEKTVEKGCVTSHPSLPKGTKFVGEIDKLQREWSLQFDRYALGCRAVIEIIGLAKESLASFSSLKESVELWEKERPGMYEAAEIRVAAAGIAVVKLRNVIEKQLGSLEHIDTNQIICHIETLFSTVSDARRAADDYAISKSTK